MTLDDLLDFVSERDAIYRRWKEGDATDRERIFARMAKLTEELGELAEEVLTFHGYQRQEKLDRRESDDLGDELADVVFTTLLLAKSMDIDIPEALKRKMEKIRKREAEELPNAI